MLGTAAITAVTACSGAAALHRPPNAMPIAAADAHGPGTKLRDGWVVPDGAVLAGAALPTVFPSRPGVADRDVGQWHATLAIDGPLATVMHSLREQATRLHWHGGGSCAPDSRGSTTLVDCGASYDNGHHSVNVFMTVDTGRSLLLMNFWDSVPGPSCPTESPCSEHVPTPHVEPRFRPLPSTGELLFGRFRVAAASHAVAQWNPDALRALIRVDGSPEAVVDAYVRQLRADAAGGPIFTRHETVDGWQVGVRSAYLGEEVETVTEYSSRLGTYVELALSG